MRTDGVGTDGVVVRFCSTCAEEAWFEQPGCADDHAGDCPEWACVQCGDALLIGFDAPAAGVTRARAAAHVA